MNARLTTILEINHDHLAELAGANSYLWFQLLHDLAGDYPDECKRKFLASHGIRLLAQRSDPK